MHVGKRDGRGESLREQVCLHGCREGKVVGTHCGHAKDFRALQGRALFL